MIMMMKVMMILMMTAVTVMARGAIRNIGNGGIDGGTQLDNYEWWSSGDIPIYIWVVAGLITLISLILGLWTECCPTCGFPARVKAYIFSSESVSSRSGLRINQRAETRSLGTASTKMLPISEDEFVVTYKD